MVCFHVLARRFRKLAHGTKWILDGVKKTREFGFVIALIIP